MNITNTLRKNIGTIVAVLGFMLLCIITFGDLGDLMGEEYWANVRDNITSIGFMSVGLTLIQTAIRQGVAEQALQRGLNTERTAQKYEEHKTLIKSNNDKMVYLPYFLQIYNRRHTKLRKREFLINNNFASEASLYNSGQQKLIKNYNKISIQVTAASIKWSSMEIVYNKNGRIMTLDEYRARRIRSSIVSSMVGMIGVTFLAGGLFFSPSEEPLWQKFVKLFTYIITIAVASIFTVVKEYEKGAFGVPNELDEINQIWHEFGTWEIPEWVHDEVDKLNKEDNELEVKDEQNERTHDCGTDIQDEQKEVKAVQHSGTTQLLFFPGSNDIIPRTNDA